METIEITLSPENMAAMGLRPGANAQQIATAINGLLEKAKKVEALTTERDQFKTASEQATNDLKAEREKQAKKEVSDMLKAKVDDGSITAETSNALATQYEGKPTELKAVLDTFKPSASIVDQLGNGGNGLPKDMEGMDYMALWEAGKLEQVKAEYPAQYNILKQAHDAKKAKKK